MRIEICGGIASGKTTFSKLFKNTNIQPIIENFKDNPFWKPFYLNPGKYIFETEVTFTLQHYHEIKKAQEKENIFICDFSLLGDLAYARMGLTSANIRIFESIYYEILSEIKYPDLIVHLYCSPEIELERIKNRGISTEKLIEINFLESLNKEIDCLIKHVSDKTKVVTIDSGKENFIKDREVIQRLTNGVANKIIE